MQPNTNYGAVNQGTTGTTGTTYGTTGTTTGATTGTTGMQQGQQKEGMVDKVKDMVGLGHHNKEHTHGHHHGIVPPGAPSKEDHTLYKKGSSSSSSSSSDEEVVRKERVVGTETLEQRGIPRSLPAEHVKEGTTNLPVQRIPVGPEALAANVNIPTRYPSEHIHDDRPGMYKGPTENVNQATTGVQGMHLGGEKKVTAVGAEADKLEQRDRAMGRPVEKDGSHTYGGGATHTAPHGATGRTGATTGAAHTPMTGTTSGTTPMGKTATPMGATTGATTATKTDTTTTGAHGAEHKPSMMDKVKGMLPGHHKQ